jgi:hypothetical protein
LIQSRSRGDAAKATRISKAAGRPYLASRRKLPRLRSSSVTRCVDAASAKAMSAAPKIPGNATNSIGSIVSVPSSRGKTQASVRGRANACLRTTIVASSLSPALSPQEAETESVAIRGDRTLAGAVSGDPLVFRSGLTSVTPIATARRDSRYERTDLRFLLVPRRTAAAHAGRV